MTLPARITYINPLMKVLQKSGGRVSRFEIFDMVAEELKLSDDVKYEENADGSMKYEMELNFAKHYLISESYMDSSIKGIWALTQKGYSSYYAFDEEELKEIQQNVDSRNRKKKENGNSSDIVEVEKSQTKKKTAKRKYTRKAKPVEDRSFFEAPATN